ncbi:MAG: hypothetical protein EOO99_08065 [Pedobacter sp.]|nr:MAG: hypothetical protein EOO99_08065 [Pedobacter sp.]
MKTKILLTILSFVMFIACSKKEDEKPLIKDVYSINKTSVSMNYDGEQKFTVLKNGTEVPPNNITFTNSNKSVGTIDASGLFKAKRIGETKVIAEVNGNSLTTDITVVPYSNLCKEPILSFGSNINEIKTKENRELSGQTTSALLYKGENLKLRYIMYGFEANKMNAATLLLENNTIVVEESVKFLSERYTYLGTTGGFYIFEGETITVGVGFDSSLGFYAMYLPKTVSGANNLKALKSKIESSFTNLKINNPGIKL